MMRKLMLALMVVMGMAMPMAAELCTPDAVPAATLLLPYFEVDLNEENGVTTLFSINNASAAAVLAHVVVWTDMSVPVVDFDVYLTGYDVWTMNLRDLIEDGFIYPTASLGQDAGDAISPQGEFSDDDNFASCAGKLPPPPTLGGIYLQHMQALLTGGQSGLTGLCGGYRYGDNIARGYVTVDTVNSCSILFPGDLGYFGSIPTNQNVLWGDFFRVNPGQNFAQGETLVHMEATGTSYVGEAYAPYLVGDQTFYGRYVAYGATDQREPLPSAWASRYAIGGGFDGGTDLTVWRDSNVVTGSVSCTSGAYVSWYPLTVTEGVIFDEEENPITASGCPASPCIEEDLVIPLEAQLITVGSEELPVEDNFGWIYLNLNHNDGAAGALGLAQAWVGANMDAEGRYSVGYQGVSFSQLCDGVANSPIISLP